MNPTFFKRPVDGALAMFDQGFKVFPCKTNDKKPAFDGWQKWAETATRQKIEDFGSANPTNNWGVYAGPSGLFILDIDNKGSVKGFDTLLALQKKFNAVLPQTLAVATPSGGTHLYFKGQGKSTVGALGPGLDTRSVGGYVVCPGSRIDEKIYELTNHPVADLPEWIERAAPEKPPVVLEDGALVDSGERNKILASMAGTMRSRGMNFDTILAGLLAFNEFQTAVPLPVEEVEIIARSIAKYPPGQAKAASDFTAPIEHKARRCDALTPEEKIRKRDWIMKDRYLGRFVTVIVSPGGVGKSTLTMLDAIAIATGKPLTGFPITRQCATWIYNTEDPLEELERRVYAIAREHGIPKEDLHHVHITSGQDHPLIMAKVDQSGVVINQAALDFLEEYILTNHIGMLTIDPLVGAHEGPENDNMFMDKLTKLFGRIAARTGCAICLVHHESKAGQSSAAGDMNRSRGASSTVNAARIANTIGSMTPDEAKKFGIPEEKRGWYIRLDNAKANMQPPAEFATWYERRNVILLNDDAVGTVRIAELADVSKQKDDEAMLQDRADIAKNLNRMMKIGDVWTVRDLLARLMADPDASFVFEAVKSDKRAYDYLMKLLGPGLSFDAKFFSLEFKPKNRAKHWICCSGVDANMAIFQ